jgi:cell pole-organizing protein PopZ
MAQSAKAQEPSMEEILASIRRIIADDDAAKSPPDAAEPPPTPPLSNAPPSNRAAAFQPSPPAPPPASLADPVLWRDEIDVMLNEPAPAPTHAPLKADEPAADVFELTEAMAASAPADGFRPIAGQSDQVFRDRSVEHDSEAAAVPARDEVPTPIHHEAARSLISATTSAAVDSAFNTLAHTVLVQNARTLEDLVREMLRPMLKSWLDDNLPGVVERLVRAEIERVSRGRG